MGGNSILHLWLQVLVWLAFCSLLSGHEICSYNYDKSANSMEVFWINMDKSAHRRISMENHLNSLGILHRRVRGLSIDEIYFPKDILDTWNQYEAQIETQEKIPKFFINKLNQEVNFTHVMSGLVGRQKSNRMKEIGCTASHLEAMRLAIFENRTSSPYALITEDDIFFPFTVDFDALIATAPKDFGILQVFNSNEGSMKSLWHNYLQHGSAALWVENRRRQAAAFWSTCAYIINREVMRPVIEKVAYPVAGKIHLKIVAGIEKPCRPKYTACCKHIPGTQSYAFQHESPCFWAPKGFQADSFIYAMNKTYVLAIPIITNGQGGNESTFHQDHVEGIHQSAFRRQRQYINRLITKDVPLPSFLQHACQQPLKVLMELIHRPTCTLLPYLSSATMVNISQYALPHRSLPSSLAVHSIQSRPFQLIHNLSNSVFQSKLQWSSMLRTSEIYIPSDIVDSWQDRDCLFQSKQWTQHVLSLPPNAQETTTRQFHSKDEKIQHLFVKEGMRHVVTGLCGRRKINQLSDVARLVTHLHLLHRLARSYHQNQHTRYALILENGDSLYAPFDIGYEELLASAPADFLFLRFYHTDGAAMEKYFNAYTFNQSRLWHRHAERVYDEESPRVYLVDLHKFPSSFVQEHRVSIPSAITSSSEPSIVYEYKLIAGINKPCLPSDCCSMNATTKQPFIDAMTHPTCIAFSAGIQAERFLWKLGPTYSFAVPIFTAEMSSAQMNNPAVTRVYAAHRRYFNDWINHRAPVLPFIRNRCANPVAEIKVT